MTLKAQRKLHQAGESGNWRFKGLLLAALDRDVTPNAVANAWPTPGQPSDYRFLKQSEDCNPEQAANRRVIAESGSERHRMLTDYVQDAPSTAMPKHLASDPTTELGQDSLGVHLDDAIPRMLFAASTFEEIDTLFREQLLETIMNGAEKRKIARDASNVLNVDTRRGDVPVGQDERFAPKIAQGGAIRDDREDYDTIEYDTEKRGDGARVTDEMIDHAFVDIIERQIEFVGKSVENSINRVWLNNLINNATNSFSTSSGDRGVPGVNGAYGQVDEDDFVPDSFVTHPTYRTTLFDDSNIAFANRAGTDDVIRERVFDPLLSVTHYGASSSTYNGAEDWNFDDSGDIGAIVYDSSHVHLFLYSPDGNGLTVKDYDDPVRDLRGVNARIHVDAKYSQERAASTVTR